MYFYYVGYFLGEIILQTYKKYKDLPWTSPMFEDEWYASYMSKEPRVPEHRIYVPKDTSINCISAAFISACKVGDVMVGTNQWAGYKIIMETGEEAGQIIGWPHIHLLPVILQHV